MSTTDELKSHLMWIEDESSGVRADFSHQDLKGINLKGANLYRAIIEGANLKDANLKDADLRRVNLQGADLIGANLKGANLKGANLEGANLKGANLKGANLDFASLNLWCGTQFKADSKICKQLVAHTLRIMELSDEGSLELREMMKDYKKGWHKEDEF